MEGMMASVSAIKSFQRCPRFYYNRYIHHCKSLESSIDLEFGTAVHAALAEWMYGERDVARLIKAAHDTGTDGTNWNRDIRVMMEMVIREYAEYYADDEWKTIWVEEELVKDFSDPNDPFTAKFDALVVNSKGECILVEHKTANISTQRLYTDTDKFWEAKEFDVQVGYYQQIASERGYNVDYVLWDIVKRPVLTRGRRGGARRTTEEFDEYAQSHISKKPEELQHPYLRRRKMKYLPKRLNKTTADVHQTYDMIIRAKKDNCWPHYRGSCYAFNRQCEYWKICSGETDVNDKRYYTTERRRREEREKKD